MASKRRSFISLIFINCYHLPSNVQLTKRLILPRTKWGQRLVRVKRNKHTFFYRITTSFCPRSMPFFGLSRLWGKYDVNIITFSRSCSVIVRVRVVLKRTVVGDSD